MPKREKGEWYYRVRAVNAAGVSEPSNVVGPVTVEYATIVDEMTESSHFHSEDLGKAFEYQNAQLPRSQRRCRAACGQERQFDLLRTARANSRLPPLCVLSRRSRRFPFFVSRQKMKYDSNDDNFREVPCTKQLYFSGSGDYGYWKPVLFTCKPESTDARFLKIEFPAEAQISRIEIDHDFPE